MPKIAKHIAVCLFALSVPAYLMRHHPDDFPLLIPVGLFLFLTLMVFASPRTISWTKARIKAFLVGGACVALAGFLLILVLARSDVSEFVLALPVIAIVVGIWMLTMANVIKRFYTR